MSDLPTDTDWAARFRSVRAATLRLCEPLATEDYQLQSIPDCSPPKWHLAHTSWFFETFLLAGADPEYRPFHPQFNFLFNSYYEAVGERWPRSSRGLLSRPTVAEVKDYRRAVDDSVLRVLDSNPAPELLAILELGLNHEEQHQELLLTDLKHAFGLNPLCPIYWPVAPTPPINLCPQNWKQFPNGVLEIGRAHPGFAFDNELPRHRVFLNAFEISSRTVTCGEYLQFIDAGGYSHPEFWLADGWASRLREQWHAPLYWSQVSGKWTVFSLAGSKPLNPNAPVCHVSFYEADAYARWMHARLPTESEWETAATPDSDWFGSTWQWTASPYVAYPGYRPAAGAVGEYNGKFMCNQMVLRGSSCVTPVGHSRTTYRNFFPPDARWQFSGIRLARDANRC